MRFRFDFIYRAGLLVLFLTAFWAFWAAAQETNSTTVTNAPATSTNAVPFVPFLHMGLPGLPTHALSFGLDQFPLLCKYTPLGQPLWKYLSFLIYIVLAFYAAKFLDFIINSWLKKLAGKTKTVYDDLILDLLRGPVKVVVFVILLNIGLGVFDWPGRAQFYLARGLLLIVACSMTYVALKIVDLFLGVWREKVVSPQDKIFAEQLFPIFSKTIKISLVIVAIMLTADNMGVDIKTLLAGLSVGGLALGLAAQDTIANVFGAVSILLDKPFHIGDRIKILAVDGTVESIGLRSTRIRNLDGHHVTVPNKTMGNEIITNVTRRPTIKTEMNFGLTHDTPVEKVKRATLILEEIFQSNPKTADLIISFNKFSDSALNILVVHVWNGTDAKQQLKEMQELNLKIKERFDAEKIEFAFPTQTVFVKGEKPN